MSWKEVRIVEEQGITIIDDDRLKSLDMKKIIERMIRIKKE